MFRKRLTVLGLGLILAAFSALPAWANILTGATATANCNGYTLTVNAKDLTVGKTYEIDYHFTLSCGATGGGKIVFIAAGTAQSVTASGTWTPSPLTSDCTVSGKAMLTSSGSTVPIYINGQTSTTLHCPTSCNGIPGFPNLGGASSYTVFALGGPDSGGKQTATFSNDTVHGDVGVASGATVANNAPSTIDGNVYVDSGGKFSGPGKVNGTVFTNQNLASAVGDALSASAAAAALTPNFTFGNITSNTTVTGVSGLNVVNVTGNINLNNASLTLCGPADAGFVVNVAGSLTLVGTGGVGVCSTVPVDQLLINMTGSGNSLINTHIGNTVAGTLLGPNVGGTLDGGFGSLILGQNFSLMSGVQVTFEGCK